MNSRKSEALFSLKDVSFSYSGNLIFDHISIELRHPGFYGILGPNGSGKSTFIKMLCGLLLPQKGHIFHRGIDIRKMIVRDRARKIAYVPQSTQFAFPITALNVVLLGRLPHSSMLGFESNSDLAVAENTMRITGTDHLKDRLFEELSSGEKQRVVIASALAQESPVLVLDEPTASLDVRYQLQILDLLKALTVAQNKVIIIVLHDINLAQRYCDEILLIRDPQHILSGESSQILIPAFLQEVFHVGIRKVFDPVTGLGIFHYEKPGESTA